MHQTKILSIISIIISIVGATIVYACISLNASINGITVMKDANWDIHFENLLPATLNGNAVEIQSPTINNNSTSIGDYNIKFINSNDSVIYNFEVVNKGNLDAKIAIVNIPTPKCEGKGKTSLIDSTTICDFLEYTLTYNDDFPVLTGQTLDKNERKYMKLKLKYSGKELPKEEVKISNLGISIIYEQK